jgi:DUF971 family protein
MICFLGRTPDWRGREERRRMANCVRDDHGAEAPTSVEVDRDQGVTLVWRDGHISCFALADLRANCPCAWCRNRRETGGVAGPDPGGEGAERLRVEGAELVGNWGIQLRWNDGHETGIYSWELLRLWCRCPRCSER